MSNATQADRDSQLMGALRHIEQQLDELSEAVARLEAEAGRDDDLEAKADAPGDD